MASTNIKENLDKYFCHYCANFFTTLGKYGDCPICECDGEYLNNEARLPTLRELLAMDIDVVRNDYCFNDVNLPKIMRWLYEI